MVWDTLAVFYRLKILKYYDDHNVRKWIFDPELRLRLNTGEMENNALSTLFMHNRHYFNGANDRRRGH